MSHLKTFELIFKSFFFICQVHWKLVWVLCKFEKVSSASVHACSIQNFDIFKPSLVSQHVAQLKVVSLSIHNYGTLYIKLSQEPNNFPVLPSLSKYPQKTITS